MRISNIGSHKRKLTKEEKEKLKKLIEKLEKKEKEKYPDSKIIYSSSDGKRSTNLNDLI